MIRHDLGILMEEHRKKLNSSPVHAPLEWPHKRRGWMNDRAKALMQQRAAQSFGGVTLLNSKIGESARVSTLR
jgi:hypothetical protein